MHIRIGALFQGKDKGPGPDVLWDPDRLINGHMVMTGDSGSGKTHNLRSFCTQIAATAGPGLERIHIIDPHEDIAVDGDFVIFSQSTSYAFNPLEVSPDPHSRQDVQWFLGQISIPGSLLCFLNMKDELSGVVFYEIRRKSIAYHECDGIFSSC